MNRNISIKVVVPCVNRGNFDMVTCGLEAASKDFSLFDLSKIINGEKINRQIVTHLGVITVQYELNG